VACGNRPVDLARKSGCEQAAEEYGTRMTEHNNRITGGLFMNLLSATKPENSPREYCRRDPIIMARTQVLLRKHLRLPRRVGESFPWPRHPPVVPDNIGFAAAFAARTRLSPSKLSMTSASTYLRRWLTARQRSCLCEQPSEKIERSPDHPHGCRQIPPNRRGNGTILFYFSQDALGDVVSQDRRN
jgi:hypothetical protein